MACDSSKFGNVAFARIAGLEAADLFITDTHLADEHREVLAAAAVVTIA